MRWLFTAAWIWCGLVMLIGAPRAASGQPTEVDPTSLASPFEGLPVREVRLEGLRRVSRQLVQNQIHTSVGQPYDSETIAQDYRNLTRLDEFRRIGVEAEKTEDGGVLILFVFDEWPLVADIQVTGNRRVSDQEIRSAIAMRGGDPLDSFLIARSEEQIEQLYRERGYYLVQVETDDAVLAESNIILFRVREGPRVRVKDIVFRGNDAFEDGELANQIDSKKAVFLFRVGQLDEDTIQADIQALVAYYRERGYLDVRVDRQIDLANNLKEAKLVFLIDEGPLYLLRDVRIEGASEFTREQLVALMEIKAGDVYSRDRLRNSVTAIREAYGQLGYYGVRVTDTPFRVEGENAVDLLIQIEEAPLAYTGEVKVIGNDTTQERVILRELPIRPNRPLNIVDKDRLENRVLSTGLFREVEITVREPDPIDQLYRDVVIEVEEGDTGSFNIGAAVSSDFGLFGTVSYEQRNFDLADPPESLTEFLAGRAFRGAGQTFNVTAQPGNEFSSYSVSITEPYLLGTDNALRSSLLYIERELDVYDETRYGGRFSLGRRLGDVWTIGANTRFQSVDLQDIDPKAPVDVFAVQDENAITGVGLELVRTTVDDRFRPTKGSRVQLEFEQIGLVGGDFDFSKAEFAHSVFFPIEEDFLGRTSVLSFQTRAGYLFGGDTPVYERYYLGGRSFRGFDFRTVSPKGIRNDTGTLGRDPVGGDFLFFFGTQYDFPIWDRFIGGVVFVDSGTVVEDPGFDDYRVSAGLGLRIFIPQLGQAPLAFDFGFPLMDQDRDVRQIFSFSIDLPFQ
ncbi:MAG: outer membrane protein assembly factor BamA [Phycisphaerales bacterium]